MRPETFSRIRGADILRNVCPTADRRFCGPIASIRQRLGAAEVGEQVADLAVGVAAEDALGHDGLADGRHLFDLVLREGQLPTPGRAASDLRRVDVDEEIWGLSWGRHS